MRVNIFSYGTLQNDKVQLNLFGRILNGYKDSLKGYRLSSIEIKDELIFSSNEEKYFHTVIISDNLNDTVDGTVYEISEEELLKADRYEPENYKRFKTELVSGKQAWIYAAD